MYVKYVVIILTNLLLENTEGQCHMGMYEWMLSFSVSHWELGKELSVNTYFGTRGGDIKEVRSEAIRGA